MESRNYYALFYVLCDNYDHFSFYDQEFHTLEEAMQEYKDFKTIDQKELKGRKILKYVKQLGKWKDDTFSHAETYKEMEYTEGFVRKLKIKNALDGIS